MESTLPEIRCGGCRRLLAKGRAAVLEIKCPRCGLLNQLRAGCAEDVVWGVHMGNLLSWTLTRPVRCQFATCEADGSALAELVTMIQSAIERLTTSEQMADQPEALPPLPAEAPGRNRYRHESQFGVIVICDGEADQTRTYEALRGLGYRCKVVCV